MFEVGKKVICIKDHSNGVVKRGDVRELLAIKKGHCVACRGTLLDVGIASLAPIGERKVICTAHNTVTKNDGIWWVDSVLFAPYDDSLSELTVDALLEFIDQPITV